MAAAIRGALSDDGAWLLVDIKAHESFAENAEKNPMASMMYGISVLSCLSSALSEPGGAGLGTLGMTPATAESLAREAGFTRFRRLDIDHPVKLGRASCRERVCPYGVDLGGRRIVKKKK